MSKDRRNRKEKEMPYPELVKFLRRTTRRGPGEAEEEAFRAIYPRHKNRKKREY